MIFKKYAILHIIWYLYKALKFAHRHALVHDVQYVYNIMCVYVYSVRVECCIFEPEDILTRSERKYFHANTDAYI